MRVLLVHGLGRTPLSMLRLARYLQRAGAGASLFGYVPEVERFDRIVERLQRRMEELAEAGYAAVGHSLGGLLLRVATAGLGPGVRLPSHIVMLGTPNRSPRMARSVRRWLLYRMACGDAGQLLASPDRMAALPVPCVPVTVIAGTRGLPFMRGQFRGEANDGLVAASETRMDGREEYIEVPARHTFMMNHPQVRQVILTRCLQSPDS
ncbi:MAG: alpha/beta hydrolase [Phycisphaerae bacterium]|nr:alpha/beta hydrolase [Phycisphaerae bacterium]